MPLLERKKASTLSFEYGERGGEVLYNRFTIYPVPSTPEALEQVGTKYKFWYVDENGLDTLFKAGRSGTGENWAELICVEVCEQLGLPHAKYYLATYEEMDGVISPKFTPPNSRLVLGNETLERIHDAYDATQRFRQSNHTVRIVIALLSNRSFSFPEGFELDARLTCVADLFLGYLLLDAIVGNTDRHHENWGFINHQDGRVIFFIPHETPKICLQKE